MSSPKETSARAWRRSSRNDATKWANSGAISTSWPNVWNRWSTLNNVCSEIFRTNRAVQVVSSDNCSIKGVEELLRSAVENVVRNAVRYTPEGTAVEVALRRQNGDAVISVRDRGKGVPDEALEKIFCPLYRTEDARDRQSGGGTGLGLAITERAVRIHGGSVQAANAAGGGLSVEMRFSYPGSSVF